MPDDCFEEEDEDDLFDDRYDNEEDQYDFYGDDYELEDDESPYFY
jgi:hypothetical protein